VVSTAALDASPPSMLPRGLTGGAAGPGPRGSCDSSVAVVICAYTEERWTLLVRAVRSVAAQTRPPAALVVVVDHCPGLLARASVELAAVAGVDPRPATPRLTIVANSGRRGLADSRNTGIAAVTADVVAFLDDDAAAQPEWLEQLCKHYDDPHVVGVGGRVVPEWASGRPGWFPPEFDWVVGCSYRGLPVDAAPVRNPIGANMSFRRDVVVEIGGFSPGLGRIGSVPLGCEETELSLRLAAHDRGMLMYEPAAEVVHHVPATRSTWGYFRTRCYSEGLSKAQVRALAGAGPALRSERSYLAGAVPRGVGEAVLRGVRERPGRALAAPAVMGGVAATVAGYVVGHLCALRSLSWRLWLSGAALPLALVLWWVSLGRIAPGAMTDIGLVSVLPSTYWMALGALTVGFGVTVTGPRPSAGLLAAYVLALISVLHLTPAIVYGTLRYAWAWKHVGVIDFLMRHGSLSGLPSQLAAYQGWPGFFAGNALLIRVAGFSSALSYASWSPAFFELLLLAPLLLIYRRFTTDIRLVWVGVWLFYLGNWVGQDYFSPQALCFFLYVAAAAICLRWYSSSAVPVGDHGGHAPLMALRFQRRRRTMVFAVVVVVMAAIATSHQLTPFMALTALAALVVCRRCSERVLPIVMAAITAGWILLSARGFLASNLGTIMASTGHPGGNASANLINLSQVSRGQVMVAWIDRLLSAGIWVLGAIGAWRRRKTWRADLPLLLLCVSPIPLVIANSYGGEMVFRVYLFALPFVAFFAAASLFPSDMAGRRFLPLGLIALSTLLLVGFLFSYDGKEQVNYFSPGEVAAGAWIYGHAPQGSFVVGPSGDLPWENKDVEMYRFYWFALDTPKGRKEVLANPVGSLAADLGDPRNRAAYLIFSRAQRAEVDTTGLMPAGSIRKIEDAVLQSGRFRVVFHDPDATILTLAEPAGTR
jgi:GT2 family glycosyltransferase